MSKPKASARREPGPAEKPKLPILDPLEAAQETARCAQEGAHKLGRAVEVLRQGLETLAVAEYDHEEGRPLGARDLRRIACETLDAYSALSGQNWRNPRNKIVGSRAGDRDLTNLQE